MRIKILVISATLCLIAEILFSFYYSSTTLTLNDKYNSTQSQLTQLKITNEQLEIKLAESTSLKNIQTFASEKQFVPIKKHYAF